MPGAPEEVPLLGGLANRGWVVRRGDTVRRPLRPTSSSTHALLRYLADVGFDGSPRVLGIDRSDREVLSFIPGEAVIHPYPRWALTDQALRSVAELLRRYHDAAVGFDHRAHEWPAVVPPGFRGEVVCHNDLNLDNVIFRDGQAVAFIDFDLASPGPTIWDVGGAVRFWAPLRPHHYIYDARRGHELERLREFVAAYGRDLDPERVIEAVQMTHDRMYRLIEEGGHEGHEGFARYWQEAQHRAAATAGWYAESHASLVQALESS